MLLWYNLEVNTGAESLQNITMAEILTPQEGAEPTPERAPESYSEQQVERAPETKEGAAAPVGEQIYGGAALPSPSYVPQAHDEQTHQELKATPQDQQVEKLKHMAMQEGALKAVFHAKKLAVPYVTDKFHDALMDELREQLFEEGKIEKM